MPSDTPQLIARVAFLLEHLIVSEKEEAQKLEILTSYSYILGQHSEQLGEMIERLEEISKQRIEDQAELRALIEALRTNIANSLNILTLRKEISNPDIHRSNPDFKPPENDLGHISIQSKIPLRMILIAIGAGIATISGWLWGYRTEIAKLLTQ